MDDNKLAGFKKGAKVADKKTTLYKHWVRLVVES